MKTRYVWVLLISLGVWCCESTVKLDISPEEPSIVVFSSFSNRNPIELQLTRALNVLDTTNTIEVIENANVELLKDGNFIEFLEPVKSPDLKIVVFRSSHIPQEGGQYEIKVRSDVFGETTGQSSIPMPVDIIATSSAEFTITNKPGENNQLVQDLNFDVVLVFEDPPSQSDYYHVKIFQDIHQYELNENGDTNIVQTTREELSFSPAINDNNTVANFDGGVLFNDEQFDGSTFGSRFNISARIFPRRQRLGKTYIELRTVTEEYYLYFTSLSRQLENGDQPLTQPVILYSNIENGIGVFAGYASMMDSLVIW